MQEALSELRRLGILLDGGDEKYMLQIFLRDAGQTYNDPKAANWLAERMHVTAVVLPFSVGGSDRAKDLFGLFDDTLDKLLEALK